MERNRRRTPFAIMLVCCIMGLNGRDYGRKGGGQGCARAGAAGIGGLGAGAGIRRHYAGNFDGLCPANRQGLAGPGRRMGGGRQLLLAAVSGGHPRQPGRHVGRGLSVPGGRQFRPIHLGGNHAVLRPGGEVRPAAGGGGRGGRSQSRNRGRGGGRRGRRGRGQIRSRGHCGAGSEVAGLDCPPGCGGETGSAL